MDCFFHHAVPSVAPCGGCGKPVCATCRSASGDCPSCRLAAKIDAASGARMVGGTVGASYGDPRATRTEPMPQRPAAVAVRPGTRALVALAYPFWPLALLALFDARGSRFVRRQAWQALGFNVGMYGVGALLTAAASLPILGMGAWPLIPLVVPVAVVASVVYAYKVWNGDDVDVPVVSEWVDARLPA